MFGEIGLKRRNPWEREPEPNEESYNPDVMHYITNLAHKRPKFSHEDVNKYLDIHTKRAALVASPFVVSLVSYSGDKELNQGSGIIIANDDSNTGIIFTSANLIRQLTDEEDDVAVNTLADDLKVLVKVADGRSFDGDIISTSASFKLCQPAPGDAIVSMGRYFASPYEVMAAPGVFSLDCCDYDCKELFKATCKITRCGDGGPLLNLAGDVIGITFYDDFFTPFLPINIAYKWWELYTKFGKIRRPFVGIGATNFYAADLDVAEKIIRTFPNISKGIIVEKVILGSSADAAGLRPDDVIIQCGEKVVQSFLEFLEIIWDNVGHPVELVMARAGNVNLLHPKLMVDELTSDNLNSWPRREKY